jgi:hypothetical protein
VVAGVRRELTLTLRRRLQRLEQQYRAGDRCPQCRDRPGHVLRFFHKDLPEGTPVLEENPDDAGEPCPVCGWAPVVLEIVEVVVDSRDNVARLQA